MHRVICSDKLLLMQLWARGQIEDKAEHKVCASGQTVKPPLNTTSITVYWEDATMFVTSID